jgi:hypothetical protein
MFKGDTGTSTYTIDITKTGSTDSDFAVAGIITVNNPSPIVAIINGVTDEIPGVGAATVDCGVTYPYVLLPGATLICAYSSDLPDDATRTNTATAALQNTPSGETDYSADADVIFTDPSVVVYDEVNVNDTNGGSWLFPDSGSVSYDVNFTCNTDEGTHDNTATIVETGQSDDAQVIVNCYELEVTKDADTAFDRTWEWVIDKTGDFSSLILAPGEEFTLTYDVEVDVTGYTDSEWFVEGEIAVYNPSPIAAILNDVTDVISGTGPIAVDCPVSFPYILTPGDTLYCDYSSTLSSAVDKVNTATATIQNTPSGETDFQGQSDIDFSDAVITDIDDCIDVEDSFAGYFGEVCKDAAPETFTYTRVIGPYDRDYCDTLQQIDNTGTFTTLDTGTTGDDDWTVDVEIRCTCTLTQGYWKTHSAYGPAPYDENWQNVDPDEEDTIFYLSGDTWYNVFWTPVKRNKYYSLAHQYMAARLNELNGASTTAIDDELAEAETWLETYGPHDMLWTVESGKGRLKRVVNKALLKEAGELARPLAKYNEGAIGPGHCDEQVPEGTPR